MNDGTETPYSFEREIANAKKSVKAATDALVTASADSVRTQETCKEAKRELKRARKRLDEILGR